MRCVRPITTPVTGVGRDRPAENAVGATDSRSIVIAGQARAASCRTTRRTPSAVDWRRPARTGVVGVLNAGPAAVRVFLWSEAV